MQTWKKHWFHKISFYRTAGEMKHIIQIFEKSGTINWGNFGQRGDFGQFFNISVVFLYKEFLDEMFLIVRFSYQSLWHDYLIVKFFVPRDNTEMLKNCSKSPRCPPKSTVVAGTVFSLTISKTNFWQRADMQLIKFEICKEGSLTQCTSTAFQKGPLIEEKQTEEVRFLMQEENRSTRRKTCRSKFGLETKWT